MTFAAEPVENHSGDGSGTCFLDKSTDRSKNGPSRMGCIDHQQHGPLEPTGDFHGASLVIIRICPVKKPHHPLYDADLVLRESFSRFSDFRFSHDP